jgi:hypothetical protein
MVSSFTIRIAINGNPIRPANRLSQYLYLYRLTQASSTGAYTYTFAYSYDKVGNRTVQTRTITNTQVTNYTYDAANRLTNAGGVNYTWDNNPTPLRYGDFAATSRMMAAPAICMTVRTV